MKPEEDVKVALVPINTITVSDRFRKEYGDMTKLKKSIQENGLIQGLAVMTSEDGGYRLLAGGRRLQACKELKMAEVPVRIYPDGLSALRKKAIELAENADREDMTWQEMDLLTAEVHELYIKEYGEATQGKKGGWGIEDTAKMLSRSTGSVHKSLKMAETIKHVPALKEYDRRDHAEKIVEKTTRLIKAQEIQKEIESERAETTVPMAKRKLINSYIVGDFLTDSRNMPDGLCQIAEVDPPYGIDLHKVRKRVFSDVSIDEKYTEIPYEDYVLWIKDVIVECYRILADEGWIILWFDIKRHQMYMDTLESAGFETRGIPGVWYKGQGYGQCMHPDVYLASSAEFFLYGRKGKPIIQKQGRSNVFEFKPVPPQQKNHPAERPIEMIQEVLDTFTTRDANVLVPFLGSGDTLLAANNLGMTGFGYDLTEEYKTLYVDRVNSGEIGKFRSYKEE
jgi:ParB/RepB/Spo0J family partition protein